MLSSRSRSTASTLAAQRVLLCDEVLDELQDLGVFHGVCHYHFGAPIEPLPRHSSLKR